MVYHCFGDVGIWTSLGRNENVILGLTRKSAARYTLSCEIVMHAEHEIGTKSCRNWHEIVMRAEREIGTKS